MFSRFFLFFVHFISPFALKVVQGSDNDCDLKFLGDKLHLFSMIRSSEDVLLEHFLLHYTSLGVPIRNVYFLIHNEDAVSLGKIEAVTRKWGISGSSTSVVQSYSSHVKRDAVNQWLSKLPQEAWVVYPDIDEFFTYPCTVSQKINSGTNAFRARMTDRIGKEFTLREITPEPGIEKQFPVKCPNLRNQIAGQSGKTYLFQAKKGRTMKNSHTLMDNGSPAKAEEMGYFSHYFWTSKTVKQTRLKKIGYKKTKGKKGSVQMYETILELFDDKEEPSLNQHGIEFFSHACQTV